MTEGNAWLSFAYRSRWISPHSQTVPRGHQRRPKVSNRGPKAPGAQLGPESVPPFPSHTALCRSRPSPAHNPRPSTAHRDAGRHEPLPRTDPEPCVSRRHLQNAPRVPGPGPDAYLPLLGNLDRHLAPRATERKGSSSRAEVGIKGAERRRDATRHLQVFMGNEVLRSQRRKRDKKCNLATCSVGGTGSASLILV